MAYDLRPGHCGIVGDIGPRMGVQVHGLRVWGPAAFVETLFPTSVAQSLPPASCLEEYRAALGNS